MYGTVQAVAFDEQSVGKTFGDSKTKTVWTVRISGELKQISLTNSRISGKKKVFVGENLIHENSSLFGGFTFSWRLMGNAFMIAPNSSDTGYDLFVNGVSFFDLPGNPALSNPPRHQQQRPQSSTRPYQPVSSSYQRGLPDEDVQIQRAIELSLLEEAKRRQKQQQAPSQSASQQPPEPEAKISPPRVPPPRKRPVGLSSTSSSSAAPAPAAAAPQVQTSEIPDLLDIDFSAPVVRVNAVEEFDMAKNSPASAQASVPREDSKASADDPIMDWFKAKNSLMDSSVEADVPPIESFFPSDQTSLAEQGNKEGEVTAPKEVEEVQLH